RLRRPLKDKQVGMYNCGPTVYDYVHIGNLRAFLFADILRRYLEYRRYKVKQVMNITDVGHMVADGENGEDKMSVAMRREGKGPAEVARFYEKAFFQDINTLGIKPAWKYPRATEHIPEMIALIKKLLKRGHAYLVAESAPPLTPPPQGGETNQFPPLPEGRLGGVGASVYYDLSTFPNYGKLSGNKVDDLIPGARVDVIHEKRNPYDFALWIYKPEHVLKWSAPWGAGYPGWHLECSAMSMKYLGQTLDIHTGGEDNKFPHHECEIAQSEGATGKPFARYWLHVKHLLVDGKKMSKSLGNFYTLKDLLQKGYSARAIRYALISTHYRETLNFTLESVKAAENALQRVDEVVDRLHPPSPQPSPARGEGVKRIPSPFMGEGQGEGFARLVARTRKDFIAAMDDDLNVSKALAVMFELVKKINKVMDRPSPVLRTPSPEGVEDGPSERRPRGGVGEGLKLLMEFDEVLGLGIGKSEKRTVPEEIMKLVQEREKARNKKDFGRADALRKEIAEHGYILEDTAQGPRVKLK
ncbi:cysteine--tRNA ligase, partial [Candidatus Uhrbacteria bacterium RIFCSPHIGHO2_01_FULL_47_11]